MVAAMVGLSSCQLGFQQRTNLPIPNCRPSSERPIVGGNRRTNCSRRQQNLPANCLNNCPSDRKALRVFVVSDLHTDYSENMQWVRGLSTSCYQRDVLIVAGDVAETYSNFSITMSELKKRFRTVFFVPGNHDLWCRREGDKFIDSLEKLNALLDACSDLGIETCPRIIEGLGIIPLFSWYHKSFDKEKDVTGVRIPSLEMACKDFYACKWPLQLNNDFSLARYFDTMNEKNNNAVEEVQRTTCQLITFSHFVPRYVQAPLAYPRERKRRMNGGEDWLPFCIYHGGFSDPLSPSYWSDYYSKTKRDPDNTELAPWVARFYASGVQMDIDKPLVI